MEKEGAPEIVAPSALYYLLSIGEAASSPGQLEDLVNMC